MCAMKEKKVIWVTGPAGAGKDEVCRMLEKEGFYTVDADRIGHKILNKKKNTLKQVFGGPVVRNGRVDRKVLGKRVFGSKAALKKLNSIVHPGLIMGIRSAVSSCGRARIAINAALYKELCPAFPDAPVVSVLASRALRAQRLVVSRRMPRNEAEALIGAQQKDSYYKRVSDFLILNDGGLGRLRREVKKLQFIF